MAENGSTITYTGVLEVITCWCGVKHAVPTNLAREWRERSRLNLFCPLGHSYVPAVNKLELLRAEVASLKEGREQYRKMWQDEQQSKYRVKGHLTRLKKRVAHGVCPCCKRTFKQLASHMKTKHPEYQEHQ